MPDIRDENAESRGVDLQDVVDVPRDGRHGPVPRRDRETRDPCIDCGRIEA